MHFVKDVNLKTNPEKLVSKVQILVEQGAGIFRSFP